MKIIDPHVHFFDLKKGNYHWLKSENPPFWPDKPIIQKNFNENDMKLASPMELAGFVHIEAGFNNEQPWQEIAWLESMNTMPFKSVASIDLTSSPQYFIKQVSKLLTYSSIVGVRHILDDDAEQILSNKNTATNLATLATNNLHFELQMPLANLAAVSLLEKLLKNAPHLNVIINHCGTPKLTAKQNQAWFDGMGLLSEYPKVTIKCSGWEMFSRHYSNHQLTRVIKACIAIFSMDRVMLASNFPLLLFSCSYQELWQSYRVAFGLTSNELEQLCYQNARRYYRFSD
ncbi:amidohydrolase family protein [Thalassotalea sp. M1531]|uniref:Amidohydrolase family protein n=1 Tax=Thalassotalea algicola TaxID=2716224 RepID=A0A7Y0Q617_9GAMM|nr:amidohydrolase family protein [Thalassotalea algicola]NMP30918.1 amidohydrolase family protein [Thalassotalea algicola]